MLCKGLWHRKYGNDKKHSVKSEIKLKKKKKDHGMNSHSLLRFLCIFVSFSLSWCHYTKNYCIIFAF